MGADKKRELLSKTKKAFYEEIRKAQQSFTPTKQIQGYGGSAIVGEKHYPNVSTYNISNSQKKASYANTTDLVKQPYSQIFKTKALNVLGEAPKQRVKHPSQKILTELRDIYKSKYPIEFASSFEKEISLTKPVTHSVAGIIGTNNPLQSLEATQNSATSPLIEKYTQDDIKSHHSIIALYEKGYNEHQLMNLLALGSFGIASQKRLVPTKWAISAYDKLIENHLYSFIRTYSIMSSYEVYSYEDKGNYFLIIFFPEPFQGEIIEAWENVVEQDYVSHHNKLDKKEPETAGGYWATKIAIHEFFRKRKKQGAYLSIRVISEYDVPLGVVFVRECVREALSKKPKFVTSDKQELENYLKLYSSHMPLYIKSKIKKELEQQKKITSYF